VPYTQILQSPLSPSVSPVEIYYRDWGVGSPLVLLHGGWGYGIYDFARQVDVFADRFRIIAPDRTGYGRSPRIDDLPPDFHNAAATETFQVLDALGVESPILWGHSDGAVIAAIMGLTEPHRVRGLILEAFHFDRNKISSRPFFRTMVDAPEQFGERVCSKLAEDHGVDYWPKVLRAGGRAWLRIIEDSGKPEKDLYGGRLSELAPPTVFIHGSSDPRTEPGELEAIPSALPQCSIRLIEGGGHSPHSGTASFAQCNLIAEEFLSRL
jgi:pimeloyl-ACP methyl ester carboxylesterase